MKVQCILKRAGGTFVALAAASYHFKPESGNFDDPHVCEVEDADDLATLLAIPEGYRLFIQPATAPAAEPVARTVALPAADANVMPVSGNAVAGAAQPPTHPAPAAAEATKPLTAAQKKAAAKAAAKAEAAEAAEDDQPGDDDADQVREELGELDNEELEDEYLRVFGAAPPEDMDRAAQIEAIASKPAAGA